MKATERDVQLAVQEGRKIAYKVTLSYNSGKPISVDQASARKALEEANFGPRTVLGVMFTATKALPDVIPSAIAINADEPNPSLKCPPAGKPPAVRPLTVKPLFARDPTSSALRKRVAVVAAFREGALR